jgi:hypothetical protein
LLALVPVANARITLVGPATAGSYNDRFEFIGRGWRPSRQATAVYYQFETDKTATKTFAVNVSRTGTFNFGFTKPNVGVAQGRTGKMCFRQFDTRTRKTNQRCASFYVLPSTVRVEPDYVKPGETVLLHVAGWVPGTHLTAQVTEPNGFQPNPLQLTTVTSNRFFDFGSPFGRVFIPMGGAAQTLTLASNSAPGIYPVFVTAGQQDDRGQVVGSRSAFRVAS